MAITYYVVENDECSIRKGHTGYIIDTIYMKRELINTFKEFDVEYYAKSLRHLKVLIASMLDDSERFMTVYQH